jgi:hypothetical protein
MSAELVEDSQLNLNPAFQQRCTRLLVDYLGRGEFYLTVCPTAKVTHVGPVQGLRCGLCETYHAWLTIDREEVRAMSQGKVPKRVKEFFDHQTNLVQ